MANRTVSLVIRYRGSDGKWRRSPAARGRNGRVRPGYAEVKGEQIAVDPYTYDLRYYEGRKPKYMAAGDHAAEADATRAQREKGAVARIVAEDAGLHIEQEKDRLTIKEAAARYISDAKARGAIEAMGQAQVVMDEFQTVCRRIYLDEITRNDILRFHEVLRKRGCAPRTVANKHDRLKSCLRFAGADLSIVPPKPRYDKELPTVYTPEQIAAILDAAEGSLRVAISLALKCGLRMQEIAHLEWRDIDFHEEILRVRSKPAWEWRVKDKEERDIPIPDDLIELLNNWHRENETAALVVGTHGDQPDRHLLRSLKRLALRAGLNCGICQGCRSPLQECEEWTLHKFRRTYATTLLRSGIDLRTVQAFMGHADLASTMRYLRPAASNEVRAKINAVNFR